MIHHFTSEVDLFIECVHEAICEACAYEDGCNSPDYGWESVKCKCVNRHLELNRNRDLVQFILDRI